MFTFDANNNLNINQAAGGGASTTANQGTPNTLANAWPVEITDSVNGPVAVKAASTAAVATDKAVVVAVSPNNSVAVTGTFFQATQPVSIAATVAENLIQVAGTTLGATAVTNYGTAPAAVAVPGVNAFVTNTPAVTLASTTVTNTVAENLTQVAGTVLGATAVTNFGTAPAAAAVPGVNASLFIGTTVATASVAGVQKVGISGSTAATLDAVITAATAPANGIVTLAVNNTTTPTLTTGQSVATQCDSAGSTYVNTEGRKATYRAFANAFTPVTSATSPSFSIQGSATKTVRITRIRFSLTNATGAAAYTNVSLQRFSALSGGTVGTTPAAGLNDTNNAAATAVVQTWSTLNTTATASGGPADGFRYPQLTAATTQLIPAPYELDSGGVGGQSLVLRGTSQWFGVILNSLGTTPVCDIVIEWTEE